MASAEETVESITGAVVLAVAALVILPLLQILPTEGPLSGAASLLQFVPFVFGAVAVIVIAMAVADVLGDVL